MKINKLEFNKVNTSYASEQFSNMIVESEKELIVESEKKFKKIKEIKKYKTYFLNGKWGSGKTTFLQESEENSNGALKKDGWSVKYLKLWEIKDDRSVIELAFRVLLPKYYYCLWIFVILSISVSLLLTPAFNLGFSGLFDIDYFIGPIIKIILTILGLSVSIYQLLKLKSDYIFIILFDKLLKSKGRKIVLVIDDFDRISSEKQEESYKLFNVLHGYIPIVFVGDLDNLVNDEKVSKEFLNKIIDKRVELPVAINSKNVLKNYISSLKKQLIDEDNFYNNDFIVINDFLDKDFLNSNLTLREINHFKSLLDSEMLKKEGRVRLSQQIVIIYLYLFDSQKYNELRKNYDSNEKKVRISGFYEKDEKDKTKYNNINTILFNSLGKDYVPLAFEMGPVSYFINDNIENLSVSKAEEILENLYNNIEIIDALGENKAEFLSFINQTTIELEKLKTLLRSILSKITDPKFQDITPIVVHKIKRIFSKDSSNKLNDEFWIELTKETDISKRCYFYVKYRVFADNKSFSTIKEDLLDYINTSKKIENIPEVAFSLLQGDVSNYKSYKLCLRKLFNSEIENKEENYKILSEYFRIQEIFVDDEIQYIISGTFMDDSDVDVTPFVDFFNKEVLIVNSENTD